MKTFRCVLLIVSLLLTASAAAPATAEAAGPADRGMAWWQGAWAWFAESLPFAGWLAAPSEDDGAAPDDAETTPPEDDDSTPEVMLLDGGGDEDESGPHWDPDG